ncbi:MAG: sigma-70 family polymerase sigma factor [Glaciihabitans sp.]|nr:sigma-70 family polymerase sigma factor [Glaciihabitans sp.]
MNPAPDQTLVDRLARGDKNAFSELMTRHGPAVYRYAWALADEPHQVDDLLQDTFLVLWKSRRKVALAGDSLLPWLLTTCRFTAYNANRGLRARRTVPLDYADGTNGAGSEGDVSDELAWVHGEIAALGTVDRQLVERCLLGGESYVAAAEALGLTPAAARKRVQRTRSKLTEARTAARSTND